MNLYTLITGASKGIGKAIAFEYAKKNKNLVLVARSEKLLEALAMELSSFNIDVKILVADLVAEKAVDKVFEQLEKEKITLECLINNAGFGDAGSFASQDLQFQLDMMHLNMDVVVKMAYRFLHFTKDQQGEKYILNVASTAAFQAIPYMSIYAATKSFVLSFSESLREEVKSNNTVVSVLCPGGTETEFFKQSERLNKVTEKNKGIMMTAEAVAKIAVHGLYANKGVIIPGAFNKVGAVASQLSPRAWATKLAGKVFKV